MVDGRDATFSDEARMMSAVETLLQHREQRGGHAAETTGCSCGWCPAVSAYAKKVDEPTPLLQYAAHVADALTLDEDGAA